MSSNNNHTSEDEKQRQLQRKREDWHSAEDIRNPNRSRRTIKHRPVDQTNWTPQRKHEHKIELQRLRRQDKRAIKRNTEETLSESTMNTPQSNNNHESHGYGTPQGTLHETGFPQIPQQLPGTPAPVPLADQFNSLRRPPTPQEARALQESYESDADRALISQLANNAFLSNQNIAGDNRSIAVNAISNVRRMTPSRPSRYAAMNGESPAPARQILGKSGLDSIAENESFSPKRAAEDSLEAKKPAAKRARIPPRAPPKTPSSIGSGKSTAVKKTTPSSAKSNATTTPVSDRKARAASIPERLPLEEIASLIFSKTYTMGTMPHGEDLSRKETLPGTPLVNYKEQLNYDNIPAAIETALAENPGHSVFLFKDADSASVGPAFIEFETVNMLLCPSGECPPKYVQLKSMNGYAPFHSFADLSLDWVDVGMLSVRKNLAPLLKTFSAVHQGRVYVLVNKSRKFRHVDDETLGFFKRVSFSDCKLLQF